MNTKTKEILKLISIPAILMGIYLSMYIVWKVLGLPSNDQFLVIVKEWFGKYGLWIVFVGALIEGFLLLGQYFPGGFIIFLGVISAGKDISGAVWVVFIVCVAFFIAYTLNYLLGKYGWYKLLIKFGLGQSIEKSKDKLAKQGLNVIFFSYWEPNLASLTATAAGILQISLVKFSLYSAVGIILWNMFWGILVYTLGESALKIVGLKYIPIVFVVWVSVLIVKKYLLNNNHARFL
jgi:membrane protein DedA with SNARE-associated domain